MNKKVGLKNTKKVLTVLIQKDFHKKHIVQEEKKNKGVNMDTYNKSIQHQWFHHATWGSPKRKNEGVGKVVWHSLSEDGKVEIVDIKFGNKIYKNVSVDRLNPTDESSHSHPRKKRKKVKLEQLKQIVKEAFLEERF